MNTHNSDTQFTLIKQALQAACSADQLAWLEKSLLTASTPEVSNQDISILLAMAKRKVGDSPLPCKLILDESNSLQAREWKSCDAARILILLQLKKFQPDFTNALSQLYKFGDLGEHEAILKGLYCLDDDGQWVDNAIEACRTNIVALFSKIAINNPYPKYFFPEPAFNQLVLKSLFSDLDISGISGLKDRATATLSQMCYDYIIERHNADRSIPPSIWLAMNDKHLEETNVFWEKQLKQGDARARKHVLESLIQHSHIAADNLDLIKEISQTETSQENLALILAIQERMISN